MVGKVSLSVGRNGATTGRTANAQPRQHRRAMDLYTFLSVAVRLLGLRCPRSAANWVLGIGVY